MLRAGVGFEHRGEAAPHAVDAVVRNRISDYKDEWLVVRNRSSSSSSSHAIYIATLRRGREWNRENVHERERGRKRQVGVICWRNGNEAEGTRVWWEKERRAGGRGGEREREIWWQTKRRFGNRKRRVIDKADGKTIVIREEAAFTLLQGISRLEMLYVLFRLVSLFGLIIFSSTIVIMNDSISVNTKSFFGVRWNEKHLNFSKLLLALNRIEAFPLSYWEFHKKFHPHTNIYLIFRSRFFFRYKLQLERLLKPL